ncbi:hypothetical protein ACRRTK_023866 [Alexandromys fortis]
MSVGSPWPASSRQSTIFAGEFLQARLASELAQESVLCTALRSTRLLASSQLTGQFSAIPLGPGPGSPLASSPEGRRRLSSCLCSLVSAYLQAA